MANGQVRGHLHRTEFQATILPFLDHGRPLVDQHQQLHPLQGDVVSGQLELLVQALLVVRCAPPIIITGI